MFLQRSELALCSPDLGAFCCSSDTAGPSRRSWVPGSDVEHRCEGWEGRLGGSQCEEVPSTADGCSQRFPGAVRAGQGLEPLQG